MISASWQPTTERKRQRGRPFVRQVCIPRTQIGCLVVARRELRLLLYTTITIVGGHQFGELNLSKQCRALVLTVANNILRADINKVELFRSLSAFCSPCSLRGQAISQLIFGLAHPLLVRHYDEWSSSP